jgi:hypothetical protein
MAQNLLIEIQIQDNQVRAKIDGLQNSFDTLENTINKAREALSKMNATSQGTVKGYNEQIKSLEELRDKTAKTNEQYRSQTEEIQKLKDAQNAISGPMKGSVGDLIRQRNALKAQQKATSRTAEEFNKYQKRIVQVQGKIDQLSASSIRNVKVNEDLISNAGLAGATLTEFGRTVSDAPYGIRGMANNISQLSTLFITLISKTNGATRALSLLGKQLMGPLGLIILFQGALAALDFFFGGTKKSEEGAQSLTDALAEQATQLLIVEKLLTRGYLTMETSSKIVDSLNKKYKELNLELDEFGYLNNESSQSIKKLTQEMVLQSIAQDTLSKAFELEKQKKLESLKITEESITKFDRYIIGSRGFFTGIGNVLGFLNTNFENSVKKISELDSQINELLRSVDDPELKKALEDLLKGTNKDADNFNNLLKSINREIELLNKETDRAKELLKVQFELEDTIEKAKKRQGSEREAIITAAQERARLKRIEINEKYDALELKNAKKHSEDLEAIEFKKDEFYSLFNEKQDQRSKNEAKRRQIEKGEIGRVLAEDILALKKKAKGREEFELLKDKLIQQATKKEISSIETALLSDRLSIEERIKLQTRLADLKSSLIDFEQSKLEKLLEDIQGIANVAADLGNMFMDAEMSREERKTTLMNNQLKERLRNENLSAKEKENINKQIEANELALQKKRDIIAEKNFKLQKAAMIVNALVETYRTGILAYGSQLIIGDPTSPIRAQIAQAVAIASGLAQVAAIARTQFVPTALSAPSTGGSAGGGGASAPAQQEPLFNIVGTGTQMQLAETVAQRTGEPVKAYVVSNDVSTAQELDRNIITGSAIG